MESVTEIKPAEAEPTSERERSTIEFPYTDLDNAAEVVRGVHHAGGTACDYDQLAAQLKVEAKGGGFRLRVNGAKTFGLINYERGGRISLTELGRQLTDPQQERAAKAAAFLSVPLYLKVYEQFKGSPLPPQAGLERAIEAMGVGQKVKDKARQVMLRAAKQAGFFDAAQDRLVKPSIRQDSGADKGGSSTPNNREEGKTNGNGGGAGGDGGGGQEHPLIKGLLMTLPAPGGVWSPQERVNWLTMASSIFTMIYKGDPSTITITLATTTKGDANSVA
ncbi:MAG: hypothetical protein ACT6UH_11805 [Hydrogenophaga sp.]|uniref:hypothetical protein n=1 Tax=Hydrogenophaga sp. TaxID=1904254 RepID=UPI004035A79F